MKLLTLLSAGRSFAEVREKPAPLQLIEGLLPTFGATPGGSKTSTADDAPPQRNWLSGSTALAALRPGRCPMSGAGSADAAPRATSSRRPVQRELALEAVKVKRNDLRDEDFQIELAQPSLFGKPDGRLQLFPLAAKTGVPAWKFWARRRAVHERVAA